MLNIIIFFFKQYLELLYGIKKEKKRLNSRLYQNFIQNYQNLEAKPSFFDQILYFVFQKAFIYIFNCRYWYSVQKEEATRTQSILLPVPLVPGCLDLHDDSLPRGVHPHVLVGQVGLCDPNIPCSSFLNYKNKSRNFRSNFFFISVKQLSKLFIRKIIIIQIRAN